MKSTSVNSGLSRAVSAHLSPVHFPCRSNTSGRLRMDNNPSEAALMPVRTGRRAWLFFGSDDHAQAAANIFSLIASCQLHRIKPEQYIAELIT